MVPPIRMDGEDTCVSSPRKKGFSLNKSKPFNRRFRNVPRSDSEFRETAPPPRSQGEAAAGAGAQRGARCDRGVVIPPRRPAYIDRLPSRARLRVRSSAYSRSAPIDGAPSAIARRSRSGSGSTAQCAVRSRGSHPAEAPVLTSTAGPLGRDSASGHRRIPGPRR